MVHILIITIFFSKTVHPTVNSLFAAPNSAGAGHT